MTLSVTASDLQIDFSEDKEKSLFKWLIASFLIGKRIQAQIACEAYRVIVEHRGRDTPRKLASCTHRELVAMLGQAHYVRYDESTAERLLALASKLNEEYSGKLLDLYEASDDRADFEKRLLAFDGVGPKTVEIFMREAAGLLY
ncbi:DNA methylase [Pseudomonas alliivorans]|nr:DNA methylase [Pseudomonas alliivorans]MEE4652000.1 DNA methylase [Pseudomonas alliivorans]MEE4813215.1 DNA methylase [Pseudomonas alliivorans]MEE4872550.1 DNA methylase [Pseudomonas alliivorans]MEE4915948.1 DNA methylase [Pseudomonas alliivorans]